MFLTTSVPATADTWIKLLARYGPPALLVFVAFILFGMALRNRDLTGGQKRIQTIAFSFVWIFIFLLVILSAASWWREKHLARPRRASPTFRSSSTMTARR